MKNHAYFESQVYKKINWSELFDSASIAASSDKKIFGIANKNNFAMISQSALLKNNASVCFENNHIQILNNINQKYKNPSFQIDRIFIIDMRFEKTNSVAHPGLYMNFNNQLMYQIYHACQTIFFYTTEHLSSRKYGDMQLSRIDTIRSDLAEIIISFSRIHSFILKLTSLSQINFLIFEFQSILKKLSKLGGARAVLSGNSVNLLYHLNLYKKFIEE